MSAIRAHLSTVLFVVAALCGPMGLASYLQMVHYDNYETANWVAVLSWFGACVAALVVSRVSKPVTVPPTSVPVPLPVHPALSAGQGTLDKVRTLRDHAIAARKSAADLDSEAVKAIAAMEAELQAAKALMEVAP